MSGDDNKCMMYSKIRNKGAKQFLILILDKFGTQIFPIQFSKPLAMWRAPFEDIVTCSRSQVEGSRTSGRIRNIPFDFGFFSHFTKYLDTILHILHNLMKKLKISPFGKIGKCQNLVKYEK